MTPTPLDELEDARKKWIAAETRWRSLLRKHDIEQNRLLIGRFFRGYDNNRDCTRYIHVCSLDHSGHLVGDVISVYSADNIDFEFNVAIKNDVEFMDEISMRNYVEFLLEFNAKISSLMDQLS